MDLMYERVSVSFCAIYNLSIASGVGRMGFCICRVAWQLAWICILKKIPSNLPIVGLSWCYVVLLHGFRRWR